MKKIAALITLSILLSGCAYTGVYKLSLKHVIRQGNTTEWYGDSKIINIDKSNLSYEDDWINIIWTPLPDNFFFKLVNKSEQTIKIVWGEALYIDIYETCWRVSNSETSTVIARKSNIHGFIFPSNKLHYINSKYGSGWVRAPLFPNQSFYPDELKKMAKKYVGKTVKVLLLIQIQDHINEYIFSFNIDSFELGKGSRPY